MLYQTHLFKPMISLNSPMSFRVVCHSASQPADTQPQVSCAHLACACRRRCTTLDNAPCVEGNLPCSPAAMVVSTSNSDSAQLAPASHCCIRNSSTSSLGGNADCSDCPTMSIASLVANLILSNIPPSSASNIKKHMQAATHLSVETANVATLPHSTLPRVFQPFFWRCR